MGMQPQLPAGTLQVTAPAQGTRQCWTESQTANTCLPERGVGHHGKPRRHSFLLFNICSQFEGKHRRSPHPCGPGRSVFLLWGVSPSSPRMVWYPMGWSRVCSWWGCPQQRPPGRNPGGCLGYDVSALGGFCVGMSNRVLFPPSHDGLQRGNVQVHCRVLKKYKTPMIWSAKACKIRLKKCYFFLL